MIVFAMAGRSARFVQAGYALPKYRLPLGRRTVFHHVISGFRDLFGTERVLFVCRDEGDTPAFVTTEAKDAGLAAPDFEIVALHGPTRGQAETVALGLERTDVPDGEPLTIFNIDTIRPGFRYPDWLARERPDGYLEVFRASGSHWSFVEPAQQAAPYGPARRVTERERISNLCSTGLYHFARSDLFRSLYADATRAGAITRGERYVAPLFQRAIERGASIWYNEVPADQVRLCGTPADYERLAAHGP